MATLRYSDLAARAGTTMTSANLGTCPTTSSNPATGEPDATSLNCLAGILNGISELGNSCTISVDTTLKRAKVVSDGLDSAITFQTGSSGGATVSNLLHAYSAGAILNTHNYSMRDPLSGSAAAYRDTVIAVDKPASAAGPFTVRADATVRSGGTSGPITSRGACTARLP